MSNGQIEGFEKTNLTMTPAVHDNGNVYNGTASHLGALKMIAPHSDACKMHLHLKRIEITMKLHK